MVQSIQGKPRQSARKLLYRFKKRALSVLTQEKEAVSSLNPVPTPSGRFSAPPSMIEKDTQVQIDFGQMAPEIAVSKLEATVTSLDELDKTSLEQACTFYGRLQRPDRVLECRRILLDRHPKNATFQNYATAQFNTGDGFGALETLRNIGEAALTDRGLQIYKESRFNILRGIGQYQEAYDELSEYAAWRERKSPSIEIKLSEVERQLGHFECAYERLSGGVFQFSNNNGFMRALAACAGEVNRNQEALLIASTLSGVSKPEPADILRYIQLLWQGGHNDLLEPVYEKALKLGMKDPSLLRFVRTIAHSDPLSEIYCNRFAENARIGIDTEAAHQMCVVADRLMALNLFQEAYNASSKYIAQYRFAPRAYFVRGASAYYLEDYEQAEQDLLRCITLCPGYFEAYGILMNIVLRHSDGEELFDDLLKQRDRSHCKFQAYGSDGRRGMLDIERSQFSFMQGAFDRGQKIRQERPLCRYLEQLYPSQYTAYRDPAFSEAKKDSLLLLTEDGVGDEVRWAQYYPALVKHYNNVEVTCDPRLKSIFERSFPEIVFHAFSRRLMEKSGTKEANREAIPYFALARLLDQNLYTRLRDFSEIRLTADMVRGAWAAQPGGEPSQNGPGGKAYLHADPEIQSKWAEHFHGVASNKLKVGLLWRSSLLTPRRSKHYLDLDNMRPLLGLEDVHLVSVQPQMSSEEIEFCTMHGIEILHEVDLYDDMEEIAGVLSNLDLVLGANTFNGEMAAALGVPVWLLGAFCNMVRYRVGEGGGETDRISYNTRILRLDQQAGFVGSRAELQTRLSRYAKDELDLLVEKRKGNRRLEQA